MYKAFEFVVIGTLGFIALTSATGLIAMCILFWKTLLGF